MGSEIAREHPRIPALIARRVHPAREPILHRVESRFDPGKPVAVQHPHLHPLLAQDGGVRDALLEALLGAIEIEIALLEAVIRDAGVGHHLIEPLDGVQAQPQLAQGVDPRPFLGALGEELHAPSPHAGVRPQPQPQRLILHEE